MGAQSVLASLVTTACPTRGLRGALARHPGLGGDLAAIILCETARLLRKFPVFNAFHAEGSIHYYADVNIGFAVDDGRGLKVPVIKNADRKGIAEISAEMRELVIAYLEGKLSVESLSGATFTVSDLSGMAVSAFHPLINHGQSAILGVCAEVFPAGGAEGAFNLILAFDHQLSEGWTAARFLNDLRERLAHYESAMLAERKAPTEEPRCSRCGKGFHELAANGHALVQAVGADGGPRLLCKLCFEGWT